MNLEKKSENLSYLAQKRPLKKPIVHLLSPVARRGARRRQEARGRRGAGLFMAFAARNAV